MTEIKDKIVSLEALKYVKEDIEKKIEEDAGSVVRNTEQTFSDDEKSQARSNIGAASSDEVLQLATNKADKDFVISIFEQLKALIEEGKPDEAIAILDEAILDLAILA